MLKKISDEQTNEELQSCYRPTIIDSNFQALPFNNLGDREFELLCYSLVKQEIKKGSYHEIADIKDIALMQGVGERGRDCVLYGTNEVKGVIQCKKYSERLSRPQILKELIKFALYAIKDPSILPNQNNFKYLIYVSNDFNGKALELIHNYKQLILNEIESKEIEKYAHQVLSEYESFRVEKINPPFKKLYQLLTNIDVAGVNGTDLTNRVQENSEILNNFFNIRTVVSLDDNDKQIRKAMEDYGLKFLTDIDLKSLQARIGNINPSQRIRLGLVDFYGYSFEFFNSLEQGEYEEILNIINEINLTLNNKMMNYAVKEMKNSIMIEVESVLLKFQRIHQYSTQICLPYLLHRVMPNVVKIPKISTLNQEFISPNTSEKILNIVTQRLLSTSQCIFNGDYSILVGDKILVEEKKVLFEYLHDGLSNIEEIERQLELDIPVLLPVLEKIESDLNTLFLDNKTIVISDLTFLDEPEKLSNIADTFKRLNPES